MTEFLSNFLKIGVQIQHVRLDCKITLISTSKLNAIKRNTNAR